MTIVTQIGSNENVLCDRIVLEVGGHLGEGTHVSNAVCRIGIVRVGDIVEIHERIVLGRVLVH